LPEVISFKLCGHGRCVQHGVISFFGLGWWYVADGLQKATVVEPVDDADNTRRYILLNRVEYSTIVQMGTNPYYIARTEE